MKKFFLILLVVSMLVTTLAGCGAESAGNEETSGGVVTGATDANEVPEVSNSVDVTNGKKYKIGFMYGSYTDETGANAKRVIEYCAEVYGFEAVLIEAGWNLEDWASANQNMIEMGCDAIMAVESPEVYARAEEQGVVVMHPGSGFSSEDYRELARSMDCFAGVICEDDYTSSYASMQALYDAGCRNVALSGVIPGQMELHDTRARAAKDFLADHPDMNLVVDFYGNAGAGEGGEVAEQWLLLYPELDGIWVSSNDGSVEAAVYAAGAQEQVKLAVFDLKQSTVEALEDGCCVWAGTGQEWTYAVNIALAINLLNGDDLIEDNGTVYTRPFLQIKSMEDYEMYQKTKTGEQVVYTPEELLSLIKTYNPDVTIEDYDALNKAYSMEFILSHNS